MTPDAKRNALLDFLDKQVFLPALDADIAGYTDSGERKLLANVKGRVQRTRQRYHEQYATAADVRANFLKDLDSKFGQDLAADMWQLKLQRFETVRNKFVTLCSKLGI
jgi:hypothetical protein